MLNIKEHLKLSLIYSGVAAVPAVLQVLIQPLIEGKTRLNAIDFSHLGVSEMVTTLAFTVVLFSMGNAVSRFYYDCNNNQQQLNRMMSTVYIDMLLRGFFLLLMVFFLKDYIGLLFHQPELRAFSSYGFAAVIVGINRAVVIVAITLYRNEKRVLAFVYANIGTAIIRTIFQLIGLFYFEMSFLGYVYGSAIGTSLVTVFVLYNSFIKAGIIFDLKIYKPMLTFAFPLFQYGMVAFALTFFDKYFLEKYPTDLGIYITAVNFALGVQIIIQGIQGATQPEIFRFMKEGLKAREEEIKSLSNILMAQTQLLIATMILPVMLFLYFFYETEVRLAYVLIPLVLIRYIPKNQYVIFSFVVYYQKKTRFFLYLNIFTLGVNMVMNVLLIPHLMVYGAIISLMTADLIQVLFTYLYSQRIQPIAWNRSKLIYAPFLSVFVVIVLCYVTEKMNWSAFIAGFLSVVVIYLTIIFLYREELTNYLRKFFANFVK